MKIQADKIYSLKISNGDEVVAKVIGTTDAVITVQHPLTVVPSQAGIQLVPSLFTCGLDDEISINISNISMFAPARDQVCDSYVEATTGIKPVRNKILVE
jgi:hypothetical protein